MEIFEFSGKRFHAAIELFQEGSGISFNGATILLAADRLIVKVQSIWQPKYISQKTVSSDVDRAIKSLSHLLENSSEMSDLCAGKAPEIHITHGYGMGSVEVCRYYEGNYLWDNQFEI